MEKAAEEPDLSIPLAVRLDPHAELLWKEVVEYLESRGEDVDDLVVRLGLVGFCLSWSHFIRCKAEVDDEGHSYTTKNQGGALMKRAHPSATLAATFGAQYRDWWDKLRQLVQIPESPLDERSAREQKYLDRPR